MQSIPIFEVNAFCREIYNIEINNNFDFEYIKEIQESLDSFIDNYSNWSKEFIASSFIHGLEHIILNTLPNFVCKAKRDVFNKFEGFKQEMRRKYAD
jgi:hypothetical protein